MIKGYSFLSQKSSSSTRPEASGSPLERDFAKYLGRATSYLERVQNEGIANVDHDGNGNPGLIFLNSFTKYKLLCSGKP